MNISISELIALGGFMLSLAAMGGFVVWLIGTARNER
jgi:hypothetical protein